MAFTHVNNDTGKNRRERRGGEKGMITLENAKRMQNSSLKIGTLNMTRKY